MTVGIGIATLKPKVKEGLILPGDLREEYLTEKNPHTLEMGPEGEVQCSFTRLTHREKFFK